MNTMNQQQLVLTFISRNPKRKFTTETLTLNLNKGKTPKNRLTPARVSVCLSRLVASGYAVRYRSTGKTSEGRKVSQWQFLGTGKY